MPPCTIGSTSVDAAAVAVGKAEIATLAILEVPCKNVEPLAGADDSVWDAHNVVRVVDALQVAFGGHSNAFDLRRWLDTKLGGDFASQIVPERPKIARRE